MLHQLTAALQQIAAPVGGLHTIAVDVRQGQHQRVLTQLGAGR